MNIKVKAYCLAAVMAVSLTVEPLCGREPEKVYIEYSIPYVEVSGTIDSLVTKFIERYGDFYPSDRNHIEMELSDSVNPKIVMTVKSRGIYFPFISPIYSYHMSGVLERQGYTILINSKSADNHEILMKDDSKIIKNECTLPWFPPFADYPVFEYVLSGNKWLLTKHLEY